MLDLLKLFWVIFEIPTLQLSCPYTLCDRTLLWFITFRKKSWVVRFQCFLLSKNQTSQFHLKSFVSVKSFLFCGFLQSHINHLLTPPKFCRIKIAPFYSLAFYIFSAKCYCNLSISICIYIRGN
jgi:hypothetical protein